MITLQTASKAELATFLDWAAAEGWNPGLGDADAFYASDPNGFFVAHDEETPIAAISVVNHNDDFAFLGLYIVKAEYRGQGIGLKLWNHAVAHAGARTIGLDGVEAQQANYAKAGFVHAGGTTRFAGALAAKAHAGIRPVAPADLPGLIDREAAASGVPKPTYLQGWFSAQDTRLTFVLEDAGAFRGLCTIRQCRTGAKIGPLIADTPKDAEALLAHAAQAFDGPYFIDVPATSGALKAICEAARMAPVFKTARMYRGPAPTGQGDLYAVATLELG